MTSGTAPEGAIGESCCDEPECRRHYPIGLYLADFSGTVYVVTKRRVVSEHEDGTATFAASERHDVTPQLREFVRRNHGFVRDLLAEVNPVPRDLAGAYEGVYGDDDD